MARERGDRASEDHPAETPRPEALLAAIVQASDDAIISATLGGVSLTWNAGAERLYGYGAGEVIGRHVDLIVPDELREKERSIFDRVRRGESVAHYETVRIRRDGTRADVSLTVSPIRDRVGRIVGASKVARDITENKRAEQALRESERRYRAIVEGQAEMVCRFRPDGTILFVNGAYARTLGKTPEELTGANLWPFVSAEDRRSVRTALDRLRPEAPEIRIENRFETAAGTRWTLWTNRALVFDSRGRAAELQSVGIDITDRKNAEEALRQQSAEIRKLYHKLHEADRRKDDFLAMLAHELRNPLAPIRSGLDALALDRSVDRHTVQMLQEQLQHLVRLVDDLLDVSRITRGLIELRREPVELSTLVDRSVHAVRQLVQSRQQQLVLVMPERQVWLHADPVRVVQVIGNLLNNASKYTDPGGRIELRVEQQGEHAIIAVQDDGIGIEPELLTDVFGLFTQSSRSLDRAQGGLGIGLTLVRRLVELHGGTVTAHSGGPGRGSTFRVRLPLGERAPHAPPGVRPAGDAAGRTTILIVDDNASAANVLALLLQKLGDHDVGTVYDGPSALEWIASEHPELVLLDIGLPGMDGFEVAKSIRALPGHENVLLVALTGYGRDEDRQRTAAAGFDRHLVKPVEVAVLEDVLAETRRRRSATDHSRS